MIKLDERHHLNDDEFSISSSGAFVPANFIQFSRMTTEIKGQGQWSLRGLGGKSGCEFVWPPVADHRVSESA